MTNNVPQIPAALQEEIKKALATGGPLPPGVVAVPEGQKPPLGAIPMGISAKAPPNTNAQQSKTAHNPIPDGDEGLKILRGFANCPISQESLKLNRMLQMLIQTPATDDDSTDDILSKGLMAAIRANRYCSQNEKKRTVCIFKEDDSLNTLHQAVQDEQANLDRINKELEECVKRGNAALTERWKKAIDTYGLNPDKYLYHIDEDKGIIEQVDLECEKCKGVTVIRHARQEVTEKLMKSTNPTDTSKPSVVYPKEENHDI